MKSPRKSKEVRYLILGDLQCGSLYGLTPTGHIGTDVKATQQPLWDWYIRTLKKIGLVDGVVLMGDLIDGPGKRDSIDHLTTDTNRQKEIAIECLSHIQAKKFFAVYGTPYHVSGSEDWEKAIASHFKAPIKDRLFLDIEGHKFRFRHHAGRSDTLTAQGTPLGREGAQDIFLAQAEESVGAKYLFHAHTHYYYRVENVLQTIVSCPCLQTPMSAYGRKCRATFYDLGLIELRITRLNVNIIPHIMPIRYIKRREYLNG